MAGASTSPISTPSPAASRRSSTSPTTCATSSAASPCPATAWRSSAPHPAESGSRSNRHRSIRSRSPCGVFSARPALGITCESLRAIKDRSSRAIGDRDPRAIGDRNLAETPWRSIACGPRNFSNPESFGFFLTESAFFAAEDKRPPAAGSAP